MSLVSPPKAASNDSETDEQGTLVQRTISTALRPVHVLTSRSAVKAYLSTLLFFVTSVGLLSLSTTAYAFFYYNYIPQINLERTIYLQYGLGSHPHATAALDTNALISQQAYDVELILHMPRTPPNLAAGNFMLDLCLLGQGSPIASSVSIPESLSSILPNITSGHHLLHHSRRPSILPYASPVLSLSHTLLHLPWHLLRFRDLDSSVLTVPMFEMLSFPRGSRNIPTHIRVELQSTNANSYPSHVELQVYSMHIAFRARFQGMRYLIYNHRVLAFLAFTAVFYTVSILSMAVAWAVLSSSLLSSSSPIKTEDGEGDGERKKIKHEGEGEADSGSVSNGPVKTPTHTGTAIKHEPGEDEEDDDDEAGLSLSNLSDSGAQFPSGRGQMPLRSPGRAQAPLSSSQAGEGDGGEPSVRRGEAADDEDEGDTQGLGQRSEVGSRDRDRDSGIGTSMESENTGMGAVRRRGSRQSMTLK